MRGRCPDDAKTAARRNERPFHKFKQRTPSYARSAPEEASATAARATRPHLADRLVVQEQRDVRRQLPNLLGGEELLRRGTVDRHLIQRLVLRRAHARVGFVEVVLLGQAGEILRDGRPDRVDDLAVRLVQDGDAVGDVVAQLQRILLPQHLLERIRIAANVLLLELLLARLVALAAAAAAQAQEQILAFAFRSNVDAHVERELHRREIERARLTVGAEAWI